ncbi:MAG: FHA domain-containing protein [Acidimicrobiales bacterium]
MSSRHAEIRLQGWDPVLVDLTSTNGTFVWHREPGAWDRCRPGAEVRLEPGAVVSLGHRRFVFESSLRR